jgi:hypothetical protein
MVMAEPQKPPTPDQSLPDRSENPLELMLDLEMGLGGDRDGSASGKE